MLILDGPGFGDNIQPTGPVPFVLNPGAIGTASGVTIQQHVLQSGNPYEYAPSWNWVPPPGIGDAPQHVFNTFAIIPFNIEGPGDEPFQFLSHYQPMQVTQHLAVNRSGYPARSGDFALNPLWTPSPQVSRANDQYAGGAGGLY